MNFAFSTSQDKFARELIEKLKEVRPQEDWQYDKKAFKLKQAGTDNGGREIVCVEIELRNYFSAYESATSQERQDLIARVLADTEPYDVPDTLEAARDHILLNIVPLFDLALFTRQINQQARAKNKNASPKLIPCSPVSQFLGLIFVLDRPSSKIYLDSEVLEKWHTTPAKLFEIATVNLAKASAAGGFNGLTREPGSRLCLYQSILADGYEGARIVFPQLFSELAVQGERVFAIVNNDILFVTGSEDIEGLTLCLEAFEKAAQMPHPLPPHLLIMPTGDKSGMVKDYMPAEDSPMHEPFMRLRYLYLNYIYGIQKEVLIQDEGEDYFFASYVCYQGEKQGQGEAPIFSATTWTEGVPSSLPITDQVGFMKKKGETLESLGMLPMDEVRKKVGHLLVTTDDFPPRFKTEGFPNAKELALLFPEEK